MPVLIGTSLLAACGDARDPTSGGVEVRDAWVRTVSVDDRAMANTAAYLRIVNHSATLDRLLSARSDIARRTELHRTTIDDSGLARMAPAGVVKVAPGDSVTLEPGGLHVMLMGVRRSLEEGGSTALTLVFERAGEITVEAEVRSF